MTFNNKLEEIFNPISDEEMKDIILEDLEIKVYLKEYLTYKNNKERWQKQEKI